IRVFSKDSSLLIWWDFSNGYLIAEMFSRYFPEDIHMHSFVNGTSLSVKLSNWTMLEKFFTKRNLKPTRELIDGTIHCKPGAAEIFVQDIYTMLTNSRIKHIQEEKIDFTDRIYQDNLPLVARSTASRAIKNNISLTEIMAEPDIYKNKQKINPIAHWPLMHSLLPTLPGSSHIPASWQGEGGMRRKISNAPCQLPTKKISEEIGSHSSYFGGH
uniref:Spermatosis associated 4 n=1 Tax=Naja naja TaxID=35670 RepID=A0A8C6XC76_NAJNA